MVWSGVIGRWEGGFSSCFKVSGFSKFVIWGGWLFVCMCVVVIAFRRVCVGVVGGFCF